MAAARMSVTDCHVHLYPPAVNRNPPAWAAAHGEGHWATLCTRRRKNGRAVQSFPSLTELLRAMDAARVARAVLLGWYWEKPESCVMQNRFYASCVKAHPDRLAAFATLQPAAGRKATLDEVRRAYGEGLCGLGELSPHSQGYGVDDPVLGAALRLAATLRLPVNLHVTDPDSGNYPGRVETPLKDFVWLARKFPRTTFILAHWGGLLPLRETKALRLPNVFYDTAASPLLYAEDVWRRFLAVVPVERVLFGSDYPLNVYPRIDAAPNMARLVAEVHRATANADQLQAVVHANAARIIPW
jgi:predicted TIM-barrel fold metal-dependent hydrolase